MTARVPDARAPVPKLQTYRDELDTHIEALRDAARTLLDKRLDRLAARVGRQHPAVATDYRNARVIVDRPGAPAPDPDPGA